MTYKAPDAPGSVLIVDDERSILEMLEQFLGGRGYRVACAATADEALRAAAGDRFDVALVDLKLPDGTGLELLGPLARANPGIQCIVITAFASVESTIEALRHAVFDYITKPFDLAAIGEAVDAACIHGRLKRESEGVLERLAAANRKLEEHTRALGDKLVAINEELASSNESLNRHVARLRVLYQMGRDISSNENWSDALDRFLMALCKYLEAEGAGLLLFSGNGELLKVRTSYHLDGEVLDGALRSLGAAQRADLLPSEVFVLESLSETRPRTCLEATARWEHTVVPLLYRGRWLGFLVIAKEYAARRTYLGDYHFINTIQTILTEEVANAANISRLRNLKDFNETVLEKMGSGVVTTDREGRVLFLNARGRALAGDREIPGTRFDDLFANPFGEGGLFDRVVSAGAESRSFECMLARPGEAPIPVRLGTTAVRLDDHHGTTVIGIFDDLTARKEMEEELRRADRLRSLGELSAGVAHEIRNPLTGIATTAQVLRERLAGDAEKEAFVRVILEEIARLDGIIRSLLDFARPAVPRPADVSLARLAEDTLALLTDKARDAGVSLHYENALPDDRCLLDGDQIRQVLLNVALNGIEACDRGGAVSVFTRETADAAFIEIEVADTGRGIPDEIADKLYNPFFTTRAEGTGMGLSISRKIVESHGGRIRHRSVAGRGTSFYIELPRRMLAAAPPAAVLARE